MTQEQKAKAYDKVREKIAIRFGSNVADEIFSQFEMSEDEKVRKNIIIALKSQKDELEDFYKSHNTSESELVNWLEKQGEQKPADKVEPKFKAFDYENANIQQKDFAPKSQRMMSAKAKEALYGKPTWSEEDEERFKETLAIIETVEDINKAKDCFLGAKMWLKSLKEKIGG